MGVIVLEPHGRTTLVTRTGRFTPLILPGDLKLEEMGLPKLTENSQSTVATVLRAKTIDHNSFLSLCPLKPPSKCLILKRN